ncbi:predicted MFS family arabinose efflux permease [Ureibacillus xyleni]|uniref:Predicted MFS family arabinose efflux permease n=1 Tax=Ureibacillus xyleni TaxID=614648 RepID=A0A285RFJ2_9BACL|nr:MFS transporter [Ureibacillus xyleni]SOB92831.1 predicted MFS family arabinose efflux permease [Ureibacillus xyleni]
MNRPQLWTKNFMIICGINLFTHIVFYSLLATISQYVIGHFGRSQSEAGLAVGIYVIMAVFARLFAGKLVDVLGRKKILMSSAVLFFLAILAHQIATTYTLFLIIRAIHGFAFGFLMTATSAIMADVVPDERRGEGTGYYATAMNIAMAAGPFIGLFLLRVSTFEMFIWVLVFVAFCNVLGIFLNVPTPSRKEKAQLTFSLSDMFEKKAMPISICIFVLALGYSSLLSFLSSYTKEIGNSEVATYFFVVYAAALVVTRPFTGRLFDRFGENKLTYPMLVLVVVGYFVLSQANSGWMILLASALIGIGYGTVQSNYLAIAIKEVMSNRKATATSTFFILMDLAIGVGPYLYGILLGFMSYRSMYSWTVIWFVLAIGAYYILHGQKVSKRNRILN